jgi:hypothetical protein
MGKEEDLIVMANRLVSTRIEFCEYGRFARLLSGVSREPSSTIGAQKGDNGTILWYSSTTESLSNKLNKYAFGRSLRICHE